MPSVALLRRNDDRIDSVTKTRYLKEAEALIPQLVIPSARMEHSHPNAADTTYESISNWLRAQTRDKKSFSLLFEENMNYGFHRNLYGLKIPALFILLSTILYMLVSRQGNVVERQNITSGEGVFLFCALVGICLWTLGITKKSVERAAIAYAKELLMSLDTLYEPQAEIL